jgi:hypothetical protein
MTSLFVAADVRVGLAIGLAFVVFVVAFAWARRPRRQHLFGSWGAAYIDDESGLFWQDRECEILGCYVVERRRAE